MTQGILQLLAQDSMSGFICHFVLHWKKTGLKTAVSGLHRTSLCSDADHHHCVCLGKRLCRSVYAGLLLGGSTGHILEMRNEVRFCGWLVWCSPLMLFVGLGCMACWYKPGSKSSCHVSSCFCRSEECGGIFVWGWFQLIFTLFHDIINASEKSL